MDLLILIVTCIINLTLGLLVLIRDAYKPYARLFVSVSVLLTVWIVANYITNHEMVSLALTNVANRAAFVGGAGVLLTALLFTYEYPVKRKMSAFELAIGGVAVIIVLGLSATKLIAGEATIGVNGMLEFSVGPLLWVYVVAFVAAIVLMARNLLSISRASHQQSEARIRQARYILVAFGSTAFLGLLLNVIIPVIVGDWESTRYGPLVTVVLVATIAYTIVKHGLFDIRLAAVRGVAYIFSLITLAGVYFLTAYGVSRLLLQDQAVIVQVQNPINIALALILAFIFQPIKRFFDKLTNSIFYRDNYSTDEFLERLGQELSGAADLRSLLQRASNEIANTLQAEHGGFYVRYGGDHHVNAGTQHHSNFSLDDAALLDKYIASQGPSALVADMLIEAEPVHKLLKRHKVAIVLPLMHNGKALSYLLVGRRRSREYTRRDIRVLETIANELVIAIQNALSVQEVKDINATLQQRVNEATKELRATNKQLQRLDAAKDEFVSMASHQLRTPLTSVKGYISMVLEGDVGKVAEPQRQLLEEAFTSSERMVHLISDFLNVSRLKTGKFMIDQRPIDLAKLIKQEVDSLQSTAKARNLKLEFRIPSYFPMLYVDESKIRQVIMNFIDNAIYYSHEGSTIIVELSVNDGSAILQVRDTGIGVPKGEQSHLFTKFFRASNARKQRPDGTGVGIFLAKKVIMAHGGSIVFESSEGKGSTFGFRLPIKKLSAPADNTNELDNEPDNAKSNATGN